MLCIHTCDDEVVLFRGGFFDKQEKINYVIIFIFHVENCDKIFARQTINPNKF